VIPSKRQVKGFAWEPVLNILTHYLRYEVWAHLVLASTASNHTQEYNLKTKNNGHDKARGIRKSG
jgi:hypothetical protein